MKLIRMVKSMFSIQGKIVCVVGNLWRTQENQLVSLTSTTYFFLKECYQFEIYTEIFTDEMRRCLEFASE